MFSAKEENNKGSTYNTYRLIDDNVNKREVDFQQNVNRNNKKENYLPCKISRKDGFEIKMGLGYRFKMGKKN